MKTFVGLNVSQKKTSVCVIDHNGNKIRMANVDTHPGVNADYLFSEGFDKSKIGLETGPLCVWLYHSLKNFGLNIKWVCLQDLQKDFEQVLAIVRHTVLNKL
ncbi:TPA: IS110 family transposase [Raoultella planticola]|nr:IS110 family transposase [Raoultella planticola]